MKQQERRKKFRLSAFWRRTMAWMLMLAMIVGLMPQTGIRAKAEEDDKVLLSAENFPDPMFLFFLSQYDGDGDNYLSKTERTQDSLLNMDCNDYSITSLEGLELFPNLKTLDCSGNNLTSLDVSGFYQLTELNCSGNANLSNLILNKKIETLQCENCKLSTLILGEAKNLKTLYCSTNELTSLNLTNTDAETVYCDHNKLTELILSGKEKVLHANGNSSLKGLGIGQCSAEFQAILNAGPTSTSNGVNTYKASVYEMVLDEGIYLYKNSYVISASAEPSFAGTPTGTGTYPENTTVTLNANPKPEYLFDGWYEGSNRVSTNVSYSFTAEKNRTLTAKYITSAVRYQVNGYGSIKVNGTEVSTGRIYEYESGSTLTLTAVPENTSSFDGWYDGNDQLLSKDETYSFTIDRYLEITAKFSSCYVNARVMMGFEGLGTVTGAGNYKTGDTVTVTAYPIEGYSFKGWYDTVANIYFMDPVSKENPYQFVAQDNISLFAAFTKPVLSLETIPSSYLSGIEGSLPGEYDAGTQITLTAVDDESYAFDAWYQDGELVSTEPTYTFTIMNDCTIQAKFRFKITVTFDSDDYGTGTMTPIQTTENSTIVLPECTFTPQTGYAFDGWSVLGNLYKPGDEVVIGDVDDISLYLYLDCLTVTACWKELDTSIDLDEKNFPDDIFRNHLKYYYDKDHNDKLTAGEIGAITELEMSGLTENGKRIETLKGIEYLTSLEKLYCANSALTSLDLSQNTALKVLYCSGNQLTELKLAKNGSLEELVCSGNSGLKTLDLSTLASLKTLSCYSCQLTNISFCPNGALEEIVCNGNQLTTLNLSSLSTLKNLVCNGNKLTSITFGKNNALETINCYNNQLTTLDISSLAALKELDCANNKLTSISFCPNGALKELNCYENQLTTLDLSTLAQLETLDCKNNKLTNLSFYPNGALQTIDCSSNQLTMLDVSALANLERLNCSNNKLKAISLSNGLKTLYCSNNQLTSLDLSKLNQLQMVVCNKNKLTELKFNTIAPLKEVYCSENQLTSLNLSGMTALEKLSCSSNSLTSLDLSSNSALKYLDCSQCNLQNLDVRANKNLTHLYCSENQIVVIDVSENSKLYWLDVRSNNLSNLDISYCTDLWYLDIRSNTMLTVLDISQNNYLKKNGGGILYHDPQQIIYETLPKKVMISIAPSPEAGGNVMGGGEAIVGQSMMVVAFANAGYVFTGWKEENTIVSTDYLYSFQATENRILTACFEVGCCVSFDPGDGTGYMQSVYVAKNSKYKLPECGFTRPEGKVFSKWNLGNVGVEITIKKDTTITAKWVEGYYVSVTTDSDPGFYVLEGAGEYQKGKAVTVKAKINDDSLMIVDRMEIDGVTVSTKDTYTFTPAKHTEVKVVFAEAFEMLFYGDNGEMESLWTKVRKGGSMILPKCPEEAPEGMIFDYWDIDGEKYYPGDVVVDCGDETVIASAEWKEKITTPSVVRSIATALDGTIGLQFFISFPAEIEDEGNYAVMTLNGRTVEQKASEAGRQMIGSYNCYYFTMPVYAKEMFDDVTLKIYDRSGNQIRLESTKGADFTASGCQYSVAKYLEFVQTLSSTSEKMKKLATNMLEYGIAAKIHLGYNSENYAVSESTTKIEASVMNDYVAGQTGNRPADITGLSFSLDLKSVTALTMDFTFASEEVAKNYKFKVDGASQTPSWNGATCTLQVYNIGAKDLDEPHDYTVTDSEGNDLWTVTVSALTYARKAIMNGTTEHDDRKTVIGQGIYLYSKAANDYFTK